MQETAFVLCYPYIYSNFYFNVQVTAKISLFCCFCCSGCFCFCYRFSYGQINQFRDQNDWNEQVWPRSRLQKKCHPFRVSPVTPSHTITEPFYGTISMTKYAEKLLQFLTPKVSSICIWNLRKCKHKKALLHRCAEFRKN